MWNGNLCRMTAAKHRVELGDEETQPFHSALYHAEPMSKKFEKIKIKKMLFQNIVKPAQAKCAAPFVSALIKDGTLRFCVYYRKLDAVMKQ